MATLRAHHSRDNKYRRIGPTDKVGNSQRLLVSLLALRLPPYEVIPFVSAMNAVSRFSSSSRSSVSLWPAATSSVARSL